MPSRVRITIGLRVERVRIAMKLDPLLSPFESHATKADSLSSLPLDWINGPAYVIDLAKLRRNLRRLDEIQQRTGCDILLALKGFSTYAAFDTMRPYLAGCCASGLWEARLAKEKFGKQVHAYSPAFRDSEIREILSISDHIVFNSLNQWQRYQNLCGEFNVEAGIRINPECSTGEVEIYNPCSLHSRLGIRAEELLSSAPGILEGVSGFHCHTLCQQTSKPLEETLAKVEEKYRHWLPRLRWFNMGGGHHVTREDYDTEHLIQLINDFQSRWDLKVFLEPGEAHVYHAGYLVATVLDIISNGMNIAIADVSATSHMPDVLEMPYRPPLYQSGESGEKRYTYRIGSQSCLSGDIIGDYSFDETLQIGDRLIFEDQAQYTMVKTTCFNGIQHPSIATWDSETGEFSIDREFTYHDFVSRLGSPAWLNG